MKKRIALFIFCVLCLAGCGKVLPEHSSSGEKASQKQESEKKRPSDDVQEESKREEEKQEETLDGTSEETQTSLKEKEPYAWTEGRKEEIALTLLGESLEYTPILVEEITAFLDEEGIKYEGFYDTNIRINLTLEDGTYLVFLKTRNSDMEDTGYQLMMINQAFNAADFQENYYNAYDYIGDQYYYPELSERIVAEDEIWGMNKLDCAIARNELFAKYGRKFSDSFLQNIFAVKTWYEPKYEPAEFDAKSQEFLTEIERENLQTILRVEKQYGYRKSGDDLSKPVKEFLSGSWFDLDGDGKKEQVFYQAEGIAEETEYITYPETVKLIVGEEELVYEGYNAQLHGYITSMDDRQYYIIVGDDGASADYSSAFYRYADGHLTEVGRMYAHPASLTVYPDKVYAPEEIYHFQCQPVQFRYELTDGFFEKKEEEYYEYRGNAAIAQQEIPLYASKECREISLTIAPGEEVRIMGGDLRLRVLLQKVSTGEEGWLKVEEFHNCILPSGEVIYSGDLFSGLYFYG